MLTSRPPADPAQLVLSTINSSKTSYAQFTFSEAFFDSYKTSQTHKAGVKCHINAKVRITPSDGH